MTNQSATQKFKVNQTGNATVTLPAVDYNQLANKPVIGDGQITVVQPGISNQSFKVNDTGNKTITLVDTKYGAGNGINLGGGNFSAKAGDTTITVDSAGIKVNPNNLGIGKGEITFVQAGRGNQTINVNQSGNKTITFDNTKYGAGDGMTLSGTTFKAKAGNAILLLLIPRVLRLTQMPYQL